MVWTQRRGYDWETESCAFSSIFWQTVEGYQLPIHGVSGCEMQHLRMRKMPTLPSLRSTLPGLGGLFLSAVGLKEVCETVFGQFLRCSGVFRSKLVSRTREGQARTKLRCDFENVPNWIVAITLRRDAARPKSDPTRLLTIVLARFEHEFVRSESNKLAQWFGRATSRRSMMATLGG